MGAVIRVRLRVLLLLGEEEWGRWGHTGLTLLLLKGRKKGVAGDIQHSFIVEGREGRAQGNYTLA